MDANDSSRIFNVNGKCNIVLKNLIIKKAMFNGGGAVIYQNSGNLSIINCTFTDFNYSATESVTGAAIYMSTASRLNIYNLNYFNNQITFQKDVEGLIAYMPDNSICNVETLNFYNNNITQRNANMANSIGFSINSKSKINMSKVNYHDNRLMFAGNIYGGLIYAESNSNVMISDFNYTDNYVKGLYTYGGVVYSYSKTIMDANNVVAKNNVFDTYTLIGGILFSYSNDNNANANMINFINNTIISRLYSIAGSVIALFGTNNLVIMNNSLIKDNNITCIGSGQYLYVSGGSVYLGAKGTLKIYNTRFINQTVYSYGKMTGGSISLDENSNFYGENISEVNSTFYSTLGIFGGSIYVVKNSYSVLTNSYYSGNREFGNIRDKSQETHGVVDLIGRGIVSNCNFTNNYASQGLGIALRIGPGTYNDPFIVEHCNFINNTADSSRNNSGRTHYMDHGGAMCISGALGGSAIIRKCLFENNTNSQGGAITPHNHCLVEDCRFINNVATKFYGGAISTEDIINPIDNVDVTIRNCYFKNNGAPIGGAIQAKGDQVFIDNCTFEDNVAVQGGAVFLQGKNLRVYNSTFTDNNATHNLDSRGIVTGTTHLPQVNEWTALGGAVYIYGNSARLDGNTFKFNSAIHQSEEIDEGKGGAIYIYGENSKNINSLFEDNYAHSGNGSALYVYGANANVDNCRFYDHDSERGTVFIIGSNAEILKSLFKNNTASNGGAGVYIDGNRTLINETEFEANNATIHGGAIHSYGDHVRILNSRFISNNAHPHDDEMDYGLGGGIYTRGDYNDIAYCEFRFNTARNGSAIYNRGKELTVEDCNFHYNQAYSYNLLIKVKPVVSKYTKDNRIEINITHIGGDNIINAIYNDGSYKNIYFYNVTYEHSSTEGGKRNSGLNKVNPVESADVSNNGELIYQDSREDLQIINVTIAREEYSGLLGATEINGDVIQEFSGRTGLYGNISFTLTGDLKPGTYNVYASHPDDRLYKGIDNTTRFEIAPQVDLKITKSSDRDTYFVGDTATYTITIESFGTEAHDVDVREILPEGFLIIDYTATNGEFGDNVWYIPTVAEGAIETLTVKVKLDTNGTFTNIVIVSAKEEDINQTNNIANKTITVKNYVDLDVSKTSDVEKVIVGEPIVWTITVKNNGIINATGVKATDKLPDGLKYMSHSSSKGEYDPDTGVWSIGELAVNETVSLQITTIALKLGSVTNTISVISNEDDNSTDNNDANATVEVTDVEKDYQEDYQEDDEPEDDNQEEDADETPINEIKKNSSSRFNGHATGNPIVLLLLALVSVCIAVKRKF